MQVLCPDACRKAEVYVVGDTDRVIFIFEAYDREDGTKNFLLGDAHVVGHVHENCRSDELALSITLALERMTAENAFRAILPCHRDHGQNFLPLWPGGDRTNLGFIFRWIADPRAFSQGDEFLDEGIVDRFLKKESRPRPIQVWPAAANIPATAPFTA